MRTKEQQRREMLAYKGNRIVLDMILGNHAGTMHKPNRFLQQFRSSNNARRKVAI